MSGRVLLYNAVLYAGLGVMSPVIAWRLLKKPQYRDGFTQKLGFGLPEHREKTIWIHAVSVGETNAAEPLVKELYNRAGVKKLSFTTTTPTGQEVAGKKLSRYADICYFPFDLAGAAWRTIHAINPAVYVMTDTEIWPNVVRTCKESGAKVILANGRISNRSYPRYRAMRWFFREVLADIDLFLMQGEEDARRIIEIGAEPRRVMVAGSLKFDNPLSPVTPAEREAMRRSLGIDADARVIFLGSVHVGEETAIRAAVNTARNVDKTRIVIAPRRIEDIGWIEKALAGSGLVAVRKTEIASGKPCPENGVPILDTFGELAKYYAVADTVFVGGSLIEHGGQNPLEPAFHGVAPIMGPSMSNFREAAKILLEAGGAWMVSSEKEIEARMTQNLTDDVIRSRAGESSRNALEPHKGATKRVADKIMEFADGR